MIEGTFLGDNRFLCFLFLNKFLKQTDLFYTDFWSVFATDKLLSEIERMVEMSMHVPLFDEA